MIAKAPNPPPRPAPIRLLLHKYPIGQQCKIAKQDKNLRVAPRGVSGSLPSNRCIIKHDIALVAPVILYNNIQDMVPVGQILLVVECGIVSRVRRSGIIGVQNEPIYCREVGVHGDADIETQSVVVCHKQTDPRSWRDR